MSFLYSFGRTFIHQSADENYMISFFRFEYITKTSILCNKLKIVGVVIQVYGSRGIQKPFHASSIHYFS